MTFYYQISLFRLSLLRHLLPAVLVVVLVFAALLLPFLLFLSFFSNFSKISFFNKTLKRWYRLADNSFNLAFNCSISSFTLIELIITLPLSYFKSLIAFSN